MKSRILFRADGGVTIGMGHIVRCLALADMLKHDFEIGFVIQQTDEKVLKTIQSEIAQIIVLPKTESYVDDVKYFSKHLKQEDIVVLDGYHFRTDYQKAVKAKCSKLICIDDLHAWHQLADVIINHADGIEQSAYSAENYTRFYLGLDYVLLRKEFLSAKVLSKKITSVKQLFISMGAADANNITEKFTEALVQLNGIEKIHLMLGSINPHLKSIDELIKNNKQVKIETHFDISAAELKSLLQNCDVAICPASSISLESCATGIGLISGSTAPNQTGILKGLIRHKAAIDFGDLTELSSENFKSNFAELMQTPKVFNEMIDCQEKMIDGKSSERLLAIFKQLSPDILHFRFAQHTDVDLYFKWANDSLVRSNSFNQTKVDYDEHVKWFNAKLISQNCKFYLFLNSNNEPVGQVRIDKSGAETVIGISVDEKFRGKSLGVEMLIKATDDYLQNNADIAITAYIKIENAASYHLFLKAGFINEKTVLEQGHESYKLFKKTES